MNKKVITFIADGFEEVEAITVVDILRRAGVICDICSVENKEILNGAHDIKIIPDLLKNDLKDINIYDAVYLPGGMPGSRKLMENDFVIETVKAFNSSGKLVSAICAAPIVLERAGVLNGRNVTSYPGMLDENSKEYNYTGEMVARDNNIITGRGAGAAAELAGEMLNALGTENKSAEIINSMFYKI